MTLEEVILAARMHHIAPHLRSVSKNDRLIANAVRAFLGSEEVVAGAARAMAAEINFSFDAFGESSRSKYLRQSRAALSSVGGE
jgi:hypothetical protein